MDTAVDLQNAVARIIAMPPDTGGDFSRGTSTRGDVYAMAAWLRSYFDDRPTRELVCLAAEDRTIIAAALVASLAGGPILLLPFSFSGQTLADMQKATGFTQAICDIPRDFPPGVKVIRPQRGDSAPPLQGIHAHPQSELLRLYTGGSTGTPRVWPKSGLNLFAEALFLARHFDISNRDRLVATISPYHIYGLLYSVMLPLVSGAVILPGIPSYPEEIIRSVHGGKVTILVSVPAHYRALRERPAKWPSLRLAFSSAGMLAIEDNLDFCRHTAAGIVEVYGSTETGGIALRNRSLGEEQFTPYPTVAWRVEDQRLLIDSPYLSPNLPRRIDGWFLTGDRVEVGERNGFSLQGRLDSITKVAGKRVDLEEIAAVIRQQPQVSDCLVLALVEGGGRENRIVAAVEGEAVDVASLRKTLASRFEPYALPRTIKTINRLPVKENGKYDRAAILLLFEP